MLGAQPSILDIIRNILKNINRFIYFYRIFHYNLNICVRFLGGGYGTILKTVY